MSNSKISQALQALFEKHRIVFWYDAKDEFKADFEQLQLHGVEKSSSTIMSLALNIGFYAKSQTTSFYYMPPILNPMT